MNNKKPSEKEHHGNVLPFRNLKSIETSQPPENTPFGAVSRRRRQRYVSVESRRLVIFHFNNLVAPRRIAKLAEVHEWEIPAIMIEHWNKRIDRERQKAAWLEQDRIRRIA